MVSAGRWPALAMLTGMLAPGAAAPDQAEPLRYLDSSFTQPEPAACGVIKRRELRFEMLAADAEPVVPSGAGPPVCLAIYHLPE